MKYPTGILREDRCEGETVVIKRSDIMMLMPDGCINPTRRNDGAFAGLGFYLSERCDWQIIKDNLGSLVLVPIKEGVG